MWPYWLLLAIPSAAALADDRPRTRALLRAHAVWVLAVLALTLFIGLRDQIGADWPRYVLKSAQDSRIGLMQVLAAKDVGYRLLDKVSGLFGFGVYGTNVLCALIFSAGLVVFARRQAYPFLALAVAVPYLVIVVAMGYTRQAVAVGFVLVALAMLGEGRRGWGAGLIVLGALFHISALVMLPFVLAGASRRLVLAGVGLMVLAGGAAFLVVLARHDLHAYLVYLEHGRSSAGAKARVMMNALPALLFLVLRRRLAFAPAADRLWFWMSLAALVMPAVLVVSPSSTVVDRLSIYFIPVQIAVYARLPVLFARPLAAVAGVIGYCAVILFGWSSYSDHVEAWVPYRSVITSDGSTAAWLQDRRLPKSKSKRPSSARDVSAPEASLSGGAAG